VAIGCLASIFAVQRGATVLFMSDAPRFDPVSPVPLYEQAADWVAGAIESGELAHGQKLPSERDLANQWQIGYQTVRRAMRELRERGLIVSVVGKGTFVR
jgi:GntR family transcriptional regulator